MANELELTCKRCGHTWLRRNLEKDPDMCPKCHNYYWNKERKRPIPEKPPSNN